MAAGGGLFALGQKSRVEVPAAFVYAGSAIGVALAGDLVTLFVFWELMAIGSTLVLWSRGSAPAYRAARRYLMIHLLGGVVLFAGITGHVADTGSVAFGAMAPDSIAHWLILAGFLVNAGAPPLSAWLPDAYPEASWSGTVFLSAFTTKAAVYALMRGFPGTELLIWVGLFMVFYGIVYALLENDMRRILAYSIVNQVGFMVAGIGIGTEMALNGAAAHAFAHIIYKALLLMSAGSVLLMTGRRKCSELGGLFRTMPLTTICGIIGALSISAFPLTSGFVSKSMISQAAADGHLHGVWLLLTAASAGVFLHAGIKFPWFVFFQKDSGLRPAEPPASMRWAMVFFAFLCIALGVWPEPLYAMLPYAVNFEPYTARPRADATAAAALLRPRVLPDAALPQAHADDHARRRLGLAPSAARRMGGARGAERCRAARRRLDRRRPRPRPARRAEPARRRGNAAGAHLAGATHGAVGAGGAARLPAAVLPVKRATAVPAKRRCTPAD